MIIDSHVHLGKCCSWASYGSWDFDTPQGITDYYSPEVHLEIMDKLKIDKAVIQTTMLPYPTPGNVEIAEILKRYPDRFEAIAIIDPLKEGAVDELTKCVTEWGFIGLKLHPFMHCFLAYLPPVHPLVERAIELKIPVMVHSGTAPHSHPLQIAMLADMFPEATIIMAHMGLSETYACDARLAAKKYDNIILETSSLTNGYINMAIEEVGAERVMFGSDAPWTGSNEIELMKLKVLNLAPDKERLVLGENAARIFGIN